MSLGTSLDGPEEINDAQRGAGYFARTMAGFERARAHGIDVGAICTFTAQSVEHVPRDFWRSIGLFLLAAADYDQLWRGNAR